MAPLSAAIAQSGHGKTPRLDLPPAEVRAKRMVRIGSEPPSTPCVQVDIAGHKSGHLDCAADRLEEAVRVARTQADAALSTVVVGSGSPDAQVGVASVAGSRLRMGRNLGTSVSPARPVIVPVNPLGRRP